MSRLSSISHTLLATTTIALLSSCGSSPEVIEVVKTSGFQPSHGPFDSNGNYIERWADKPPRRVYVDQLSKGQEQPQRTAAIKSKPTTTPVAARPVASRPKITQQPKATPKPPQRKSVKVTSKAKPPIYHTVKKGDTLYRLSIRYGSSVSAIQRANRLKGTTIRIGQKLTIPRK